jgi:uncharacterized radical SAM superfamily protein
MFKVKITYKSGKIENANIPISKYSQELKKLVDEGRLLSIEITGL